MTVIKNVRWHRIERQRQEEERRCIAATVTVLVIWAVVVGTLIWSWQ